eukprot:TRINITY_DN74261_c0_g1_i1.p1 TRINITY_DN74261_c0_g1~~TRINITY_DN74261_c0_g1_i1.p1  ORF type:complete len:426 (+),score=78.12 TRINITY_DN74261_c0_g1_i1:28-1278(+)
MASLPPTDLVEDGEGASRPDDDLDEDVVADEGAIFMADAPVALPTALAQLWPAEFPTASSAKKSIRKGNFVVNGSASIAKCATLVHPGDKVSRRAKRRENFRRYEAPPTADAASLDVAYVDDALAVVVKPAGLTVLNSREDPFSVHQMLLFSLPPSKAADALRRPSAVHRIDKATHGLLLVARTALAARILTRSFDDRRVHKRYRAVIIGAPAEGDRGIVDAPLDGRDCTSEWRVVRRLKLDGRCLTLVDLFPHTGRKHQLRRHMARIGCPIVGDDEHGRETDNRAIATSVGNNAPESDEGTLGASILMLAAVELEFPHPCLNPEAAATTTDESSPDMQSSPAATAHAEDEADEYGSVAVSHVVDKASPLPPFSLGTTGSGAETTLDEARGTLRIAIGMPQAMLDLLQRCSDDEER